jgi:predicted transcriptional regulator
LYCSANLLVIAIPVKEYDMQVLLQGKSVQESSEKHTYLEILADKYSRGILEATMEMPKSAVDLSNECGIPISTSYRRVQLLHMHGLLAISGAINQDGKKFFLYKSRVKSIITCFKNGSLEVEIVPNSNMEN